MSIIFEQLIDAMRRDDWVVKISPVSDNWISARKDQRFLLFTTMLPKQSLHLPSEFLEARSDNVLEVMIFCPQGLSSQDIVQSGLNNTQAWFVDLQTGSFFAYPPNSNTLTVEYIFSLLNPALDSTEVVESEEADAGAARANKKTAYLTYLLMGIILLVYALMTSAGGSAKTSVLIQFGAKVNSLILKGEWWRFFTSMFLHIGFIHLAFNLYALYALGPITERMFGTRRFLVIYILSGIIGSVASFLFTDAISAGASGAIFGLLGALVSRSRKNPALRKSGLAQNLIIVIAINLGIGLFQPGIDMSAHVGGLLCGLIIGRLFP